MTDLLLSEAQRDLQLELRALLGPPDASAIDVLVRGEPGFDSERWAAVLAVGAPMLSFADGTLTDLIAVGEELGRAAFPSPFHNGVVQSGWVLALGGRSEQLTSLLDGQIRYAFALTERHGRPELAAVATTAARHGDSWSLTGEKGFVPYAASADRYLVVARHGRDGLGVYEVNAGASGISVEPIPTLGRDRQCAITFRHTPATRIVDDANDVLEQAVARSLVVLGADAVGAATAALDFTVARVTTRMQWGRPIGSFQAVQHRAADMLIDVVTARDAVYDAAGRVDRGGSAARAGSDVKAFVIDAARRVSAAAHQLNGGEGIHADVPVHLWYRRIKATEPVFGSPTYHRARVAARVLDEPLIPST
jgi:alkylation response protein AidB-like acyl-CoA dehydrogenase